MGGKIFEVKEMLQIATRFVQYQNCWISDIAWIDILKFNLKYEASKSNITKAFDDFAFTKPHWKLDRNERNFRDVKDVPRIVRFYYVNTGTVANKNYTKQQWLDIYNFHRLTRLIMNFNKIQSKSDRGDQMYKHVDARFSISNTEENVESEQRSNVTQVSTNHVNPTIGNPNTTEVSSNPVNGTVGNPNFLHQTTGNPCDEVPSYFDSLPAKKLFNPSQNETVVDCINLRINILNSIIATERGMKKYVKYADEHPLTWQQIQKVTHQCVILRGCYYCALRDMDAVGNWADIINKTIKEMSKFGIKGIENYRTVQRWHLWFKKHNSFPHPNPYVQMQMKVIPKIFEVYPEAEKLVDEFASKNLETLSSESLALHVRTVILPELYRRHYDEEVENNRLPLTYVDFCHGLNVSSISPTTAWRWLKMLGYKHGCNKNVIITTGMKTKVM